GRGAYGIGAAVRAYFGHELAKTTLPEAAYLAGLIRAPETADGANPKQVDAALARRHNVLQGLVEMQKIDRAEMDAADTVPFVVAAAVKQGISLRSKFNSPSQITLQRANAGANWNVHNAEASSGVLDLLEATKESSNTVFAQLMLKVQPENVIPLAKDMGIESPLPEVNS